MEQVIALAVSPNLAAVIGVAFIIICAVLFYGVYLGWNASVRKFGRHAQDMSDQFDRLNAMAERDPARLGIDLGKQYAANKMRDTLDRLDAETDE